jgi:hypothetical protein
MNSLTLKEMGFSQPCLLKTISFSSLPSNGSSVLALIDTSLTGKAETDILFISRSKKPAKKILGGYLAGAGGKNTKKINASLLSDGYIEKTAISWMACEKPKAMQKELLGKYVKEHGKVPLWNASKKKIEKVQKVATAKKKSTTIVSNKVAKTKKPIALAKAKAIKPTSAKSTISAKAAVSPKPTEPSPSASSNHVGSDSTQKTE